MTTLAQKQQVLVIHNVLASATFECNNKIDLDKSSTVLGNSYYNPEEFPALRIDVRGKSGSIYTLSLFESGKIQSTGGCRTYEVKTAMIKISKRLAAKLNYKINLKNFEIQNVLAVYDNCYPINLVKFVSDFNGIVDYEPDRFPAARVRIVVPPLESALNNSNSQAELDHLKVTQEKKKKNVSVKLRRLLMGELESEKHCLESLSTEGAVGSYMITSGAKRAYTPHTLKEAKINKEESVTANVFSTGKITFTGAKSIRSLNYVVEILKPFVDSYSFHSSSLKTTNTLSLQTLNSINDPDVLTGIQLFHEAENTSPNNTSDNVLQERIQALQKQQSSLEHFNSTSCFQMPTPSHADLLLFKTGF
ncbi:uncharacterized protein LOC128883659 [Hylaeus volcanicus]|uniref:uncharacterized protein LOC128883659 n=1 Tax=Hylaeus volcanicus TaxID=313075 RepID=UPI0023B879FC|nr:uncharacterized protein LOC128883659 [Hylaeus volcanicus]XP_053992227.1 uncharacterized protein LOC128883659 [Hylaeus volcanicus]